MIRRLLPLVVPAVVATSAAAQPAPVALVGATLIDGTDRPPRPDAVIVIRNGWIDAVGDRATTPIPRGSRVVDLRGRFVTPGFVDMHSHIAIGAWIFDTVQGRPTLRYDYDESATRELA